MEVDVFCFQEILSGGFGITARQERKDSFEKMQELLSEHNGLFFEYGDGGYYSEKSSTLDFKYGVACFVKESIPHTNLGGTPLYTTEQKWKDYPGRLAAGALQGVLVQGCAIGNVHGLWQEGTNKRDSEARDEQLATIRHFFANRPEKTVLCGDFNVIPGTRFLHSLGESYQNLIEVHNITSTRSSLYEKELRLADYMFVDKRLTVTDFRVEDVTVSDHLPLVVELEM